MASINTVYENLHIFAYYRGGTELEIVKSGFENCKKVIEMMKNSLGRTSQQSMVNETQVKYYTKKPKK